MVAKNQRNSESSTRFTRLETAVLDALVQDPTVVSPDLAAQIRRSHASRRLNTAFGYYVEIRTDRAVSHALAGETGRFGTVHAMIGGLQESVSFQIELFQGRLIGLYADSYGQDTRSIDFTSAHLTDLFRLDGSGRSVPMQMPLRTHDQKQTSTERRAAAMPSPEVKALVRAALAQRPDASQRPNPASSNGPVPKTSQTGSRTRQDLARLAIDRAVVPPGDVEEARKSLLFGLWTAIGSVAVFFVLAFGVPVAVAGILAFFIGRAVKDPKVLDAINTSLKKSQELHALKVAASRTNTSR